MIWLFELEAAVAVVVWPALRPKVTTSWPCLTSLKRAMASWWVMPCTDRPLIEYISSPVIKERSSSMRGIEIKRRTKENRRTGRFARNSILSLLSTKIYWNLAIIYLYTFRENAQCLTVGKYRFDVYAHVPFGTVFAADNWKAQAFLTRTLFELDCLYGKMLWVAGRLSR